MIPPIDPAGVLTAVLSAALFTVAIVYVVRSKATAIETPLVDAFAGEGPPVERGLFVTITPERPSSWRGFALSALLHIIVLGGTPLLPYIFPEKLNFDARKYHVRMMEFRLPAPLVYTPPERSEAKREARSTPKQTGRGAPQLKNAPAAAVAAERPKLVLPWSPKTGSKDVIIQPDEAPDLSVAVPHLPSTFLWAQGPAPFEPTRVVGARQRAPLQVFSLPQAAPKVQRPNKEVAISELQIGAAPQMTFRAPQLPVLPANVSPVRAPAPKLETPGELPASALPGGAPMNLVALMQTPAPSASGYVLEAGNRLTEAQPASAGASPGGREGAAGSSSSNAGSGASAAAKGGYGDLLAAGASGNAAGSASGSDKRAEPSLPKSTTPSPPAGNLGVIIVQQSSIEAVLEGGEVLSGQPVYTVYFDVPGAPRRWILQYCVPGSVSQPSMAASDGVVRITPRRSVRPPFPLERIPVDFKGYQGEARRLVLYATVNDRGEPENVRIVRGTGQPIDAMALDTLKRWAFRPAMRGETPVAVEALFGIPLQ